MQKIKDFFHSQNSIKSATGILVITLLFSNIMGMIRDHFLAQKIPISMLDTYYAAFRLPDLIFNLLVLGAISAAFIPVFTNYLSKNEEKEAWHMANSFLNIAIIALIIFTIILAILMPYLMPLLVPHFTPEKQDLTTKLARVMLLSPIFFGISYIFGGILNSYKRFVAYSIAPLFYNLAIILATVFLADKYGVWGVAYGVIIGAFLHMLIQVPAVVKLGYKYQPILDIRNSGVRKIFKLMVPRTIGLGSMQLMLLVYTAIASTLTSGSVAIYNLADNIQTMPIVVFGTSFATAIFPSLSESISLGKKDQFTSYVWKGIRAILYLLIPAGVGMIFLRAQIVRLILGSGHFGWEQTINTANTLGYLSISLFAQGLTALLARSFYALHNTKTPMIVGIISFVISIILGFVLAPIMGIVGLGLAYSIGSIMNVILLYTLLRREVAEIRSQEASAFSFIIKILWSTLAMVVAVQLAKTLVPYFADMTRFWGVLTQAVIAIVLGSSTYLLMTWLLGCEEIKDIIVLIKRRLGIEANINE